MSDVARSSPFVLQWSHGILAMERLPNVRTPSTSVNASMEPWHFSHGEMDHEDVFEIPEDASMEPWHFSHGEMDRCINAAH